MPSDVLNHALELEAKAGSIYFKERIYLVVLHSEIEEAIRFFLYFVIQDEFPLGAAGEMRVGFVPQPLKATKQLFPVRGQVRERSCAT
jgi:hypothetical protein